MFWNLHPGVPIHPHPDKSNATFFHRFTFRFVNYRPGGRVNFPVAVFTFFVDVNGSLSHSAYPYPFSSAFFLFQEEFNYISTLSF